MSYYLERKESILIRLGRGLLIWVCVPVLIMFSVLLSLDLYGTKQEVARQNKVICSMLDRIDYQAQKLAWTRADLQETRDEILVWHTRTQGEQPKSNKVKK